jgi:hypothetical protein
LLREYPEEVHSHQDTPRKNSFEIHTAFFTEVRYGGGGVNPHAGGNAPFTPIYTNEICYQDVFLDTDHDDIAC